MIKENNRILDSTGIVRKFRQRIADGHSGVPVDCPDPSKIILESVAVSTRTPVFTATCPGVRSEPVQEGRVYSLPHSCRNKCIFHGLNRRTDFTQELPTGLIIPVGRHS